MSQYPLPPMNPSAHASRLLDDCAADAAAGLPAAILSRRGNSASLAAGVMMMASALASPAHAASKGNTWDKIRDLTQVARDVNTLRTGGGIDDSRATRDSVRDVSRTLGALSSAARTLGKLERAVDPAPDLAPRGPEPR